MARYEDRTKEELDELARERDVEGRSAMSKEELVAALRGNGQDNGESNDDTSDAEWPAKPNTTDPPNTKVDGKDVLDLDRGLEDLEVEQLDGAYAVLRLGKERRLVGQADLVRVQKRIAAGIQQTY